MTADITELERAQSWFRATQEGLAEMLDLLQREAAALSARDSAALEKIALKKQELVPILDRLAAEQQRRPGGPGNAAGMEAWLNRFGAAAGPLRADWQTVVELLRACHQQNQLNGAYIGLLQRHVETSLDILQGPAHAEATYGRDGAKRRNAYSNRRSYSA